MIFLTRPLSQEVLQPGTHSDSEFGCPRNGNLDIEPKVVGGITSLQRQNRDAFSKKTCVTCEATNVATQRVSLLHHPTFNSQRSSCGSKILWSLMVVAPNFLPKMLGTWGTDTSNCSSHKEPCPNNTLLQDNTRCRMVSESHIAMEARLSNDMYTQNTNVGFSIATFDYQRVKHQNLIDENAMI